MKSGWKPFAALACSALMMNFCLAWAQKAPQAKSQKEVEALMAINSAKTPDDRLKAIDNVLTKYADTEFKPMLLQMAMQTAEQKGDFAQTTFYAQQILDADPKSAFANVTMASELARHTREFDLDKEEKLAKAEKFAAAAIANAPNQPKPRPDITDDQWNGIKKDLASQAHEALGMIASLRKKYDVAITEFKTAADTAATADPATWVRLAQAYMDAGKLDEASAAVDKALSAPNVTDQVKQIAQAKKAEIAKKRAGGSAAPPAEKP
jgi:tetratricopeptide (TPR) repeat protein